MSAADPRGALVGLRSEIEEVDRALADLLLRRVRLARDTAALKRAAGMAVLDPRREAEVVSRAVAFARERGLDPEAVRAIYWHLVGMCRSAQEAEP